MQLNRAVTTLRGVNLWSAFTLAGAVLSRPLLLFLASLALEVAVAALPFVAPAAFSAWRNVLWGLLLVGGEEMRLVSRRAARFPNCWSPYVWYGPLLAPR